MCIFLGGKKCFLALRYTDMMGSSLEMILPEPPSTTAIYQRSVGSDKFKESSGVRRTGLWCSPGWPC